MLLAGCWRNRGIKKNGSSLEMEGHKGFQKKGRNPVPCDKNNEDSTEPESLR